jgi:hypothetical protein
VNDDLSIPVTLDSAEMLQDGTIKAYGTLPAAVTEQIDKGIIHSVSISNDGIGSIFASTAPARDPFQPPRIGFDPAGPDGFAYYADYEPSPVFDSLVGDMVRRAAAQREAELEAWIQRVCEDPVGRQLVREILQRVEARQYRAAMDLALRGETTIAATPEEMAAEIAAEMKEAGEK